MADLIALTCLVIATCGAVYFTIQEVGRIRKIQNRERDRLLVRRMEGEAPMEYMLVGRTDSHMVYGARCLN